MNTAFACGLTTGLRQFATLKSGLMAEIQDFTTMSTLVETVQILLLNVFMLEAV